MAAEYEKAGAPPLRVVQRRGGYTGPAGREVYTLPLATAWRIVNRKRLPADIHQFDAFLRGCGVTGKTMTTWRDAWQHAQAESAADRAAQPVTPRRGKTEDPAPQPISPRVDRLLDALSPQDAEAGLLAALHTMISGEAKRNGVAVPAGFELVYDPSHRAHIYLRRKRPPRLLVGQKPIQRRPKPSGLPLSTAPDQAVVVECKRG